MAPAVAKIDILFTQLYPPVLFWYAAQSLQCAAASMRELMNRINNQTGGEGLQA